MSLPRDRGSPRRVEVAEVCRSFPLYQANVRPRRQYLRFSSASSPAGGVHRGRERGQRGHCGGTPLRSSSSAAGRGWPPVIVAPRCRTRLLIESDISSPARAAAAVDQARHHLRCRQRCCSEGPSASQRVNVARQNWIVACVMVRSEDRWLREIRPSASRRDHHPRLIPPGRGTVHLSAPARAGIMPAVRRNITVG